MASHPLPPTPSAQPVLQHAGAERVRSDQFNVNGLIWLVAIVAVATVVANVVVAMFATNPLVVNVTINGVTVPVLAALIALIQRLTGQQNVSIASSVDGKVSQLVHTSGEQQRAAGRADVIRQLLYKLQTLEPGSPEYNAVREQVTKEQHSFFGVAERRGTP